MSKRKKNLTAKDFDEKFEEQDISDDLDWDNSTKRVNIDFPIWMVEALDREAARLQIPRQAVIKMWLDEKLKKEDAKAG